MTEEKSYYCDPAQYAMLRRCSEKQDLTEWNNWRKDNPDEEIWLQGAGFGARRLKGDVNFSNAHCEEASFMFAHCQGAYFEQAHCEGAHFELSHCEGTHFKGAHCKDVRFIESHCEGADFNSIRGKGAYFIGTHCEGATFHYADLEDVVFLKAYLEGAKFESAIFNHKTIFIKCSVDDETLFLNTSLSSIITEPGTRAKLEQNVRRHSWEEWYTKKTARPTWAFSMLGRISKMFTRTRRSFPRLFRKRCYISEYCLRNPRIALIRLFWWISDYGYSTERILKSFLMTVLAFTVIYCVAPEMLSRPSATETSGPLNFVQLFLFSAATMMTLGFGNINAANTLGMIVVCLNLMVGYFMLAVLVTRLAVLFQTMGPGRVTKQTIHQQKRSKSEHSDTVSL